MKKIVSILYLIFFIVFAGCLKEMKEGENPAGKDSSKKIEVIDDQKLSEIIKDRNGKLLFINVWATWCEPCVQEFPDIVKIYEEYKNKDIDFLSLSADFPEQVDSVVIPFLKKNEAMFQVYLMKEKRSEQIINTLNPDWSGALPGTFIFNAKGELVKFILGASNYETFKKSIESVRTL